MKTPRFEWLVGGLLGVSLWGVVLRLLGDPWMDVIATSSVVVFAMVVETKARASRKSASLQPVSENEAPHPPRNAEFVLLVMLPQAQREALPGDLEEEFHRIRGRQGLRRARFWYWTQVVRECASLLFPFLRRLIGLTALWEIVSKVLRRSG